MTPSQQGTGVPSFVTATPLGGPLPGVRLVVKPSLRITLIREKQVYTFSKAKEKILFSLSLSKSKTVGSPLECDQSG